MTGSVIVGTSVDGFIARPDGALDFLPAEGGEPHGYVATRSFPSGLVQTEYAVETAPGVTNSDLATPTT